MNEFDDSIQNEFEMLGMRDRITWTKSQIISYVSCTLIVCMCRVCVCKNRERQCANACQRWIIFLLIALFVGIGEVLEMAAVCVRTVSSIYLTCWATAVVLSLPSVCIRVGLYYKREADWWRERERADWEKYVFAQNVDGVKGAGNGFQNSSSYGEWESVYRIIRYIQLNTYLVCVSGLFG